MILMESLTEFLRPVTLTIRLTVNIVVGHLVSGGIYELIESRLSYFYFMYIFFYLLAIRVEFLVFFIQRFVFSRLVSVYLIE